MNDDLATTRRSIRVHNIVALLAVLALLGGLGGWAANASLSGAVVAPGVIVVDSELKRVQHPTGGVIGALLVRDGQRVAEGDLLLRLDDTLTRASLGIVRVQLDELSAREARLLAEHADIREIAFPAEWLSRTEDTTLARAVAGEQRLIQARRAAREGQKSQLRERIDQLRQELVGLAAQTDAKAREIRLISSELVGVSQLYKQNLVPLQRLTALQREQARIEGERGQLLAEQARARGKIAEIEIQIIQIDQDHASSVQAELRDVQGKLAELRERRVAAEDQLQRVEIRAPQSGAVHHLAAHTVGGVIRAGDTIMEIVPQHDALVVAVRVQPGDIDQITNGMAAAVKILAGNQRTLPDIAGTVHRVGADLTRESQNGAAYFEVRIDLTEAEIARLTGLRLVPGMPAEVFIHTEERTALRYLLKPLTEQITRAFRER